MRKNILNIIFVSIFVLFSGIMLTGCLPHQHVWSEWTQFSPKTCTKDEILIRTCKECHTSEKQIGEKAEGHIFVDTVFEPTENENGYTLHECEHCDEKYSDNETCLITFESTTNNITIDSNDLPQINQIVVNKNEKIQEIESTEKFKPQSYRIYLNPTSFTLINLEKGVIKSTKITVVWDTLFPQELTEDEKEFFSIIQKIKKLENISQAYNTEKNSTNNPQTRVLQYLRQKRYGDGQWNTFGGTIESDFSEYVTTNQGNIDLASLQSYTNLKIPKTNDEIDFIHMIAIMNVIAKGSLTSSNNDLISWGGDLCQLVVELKNTNLTGTALQDKAYELFRSKNTSFSNEDLLGDIDAFNIMQIYLNQSDDKKSISSAIKDYYLNYTQSQRKQTFLSIVFPDFIDTSTGNLTKTESEMASAIVSRLSGNFLVKLWCMQNGLNFSTHSAQFNAAAMAFAKYFIE